MYISWRTYSCPACGHDLAIRIGTPIKIGTEYNQCDACGRTYRTPDKEWIHMNKSERIGHFCAPWTAAVVTVAATIGFTAGLLQETSRTLGVLKALGIVGALLIPYWFWKLSLVRQSLARCRDLGISFTE